MDGYGYAYRGYNAYNGLGPQNNDWGRSGYASTDHVCKPVIIDSEGRKQPIVTYSPNHHTVITKTVVEQVHSPSPYVAHDYKHSSPTHIEPLDQHGVWSKQRYDLSPVHDRPHQKHTSPTHVQPVEHGGLWSKQSHHSSPVHDRGPHHKRHSSPTHVEPKWNKHSNHSSPDHEKTSKFDEFITKVKTEVTRPKFGPLSATHWRQSPNSTGSHHGNTNNTTGGYDDYYRKSETVMEPTIITNGGWARPNRSAWATPPDASLSKPTNDIGAAMEYLQEAARPTSVTTSPYARYSVPISTGPKYGDTIIDNREGAKRYGTYNLSTRPMESRSSTIDSREVLRKYHGTAV